jgi:hypothetical protein
LSFVDRGGAGAGTAPIETHQFLVASFTYSSQRFIHTVD